VRAALAKPRHPRVHGSGLEPVIPVVHDTRTAETAALGNRV
jgi:hypothetical protein